MRRTLLTALAVAAGCGGPAGDSEAPPPVEGTLSLGPTPAAGAVVIFYGATPGGPPPRAAVGPDGRFSVSLAPGRYAVTVEWRAGSAENGAEGKSRVGPRYLSPAMTPLKVTVEGGTLAPAALAVTP